MEVSSIAVTVSRSSLPSVLNALQPSLSSSSLLNLFQCMFLGFCIPLRVSLKVSIWYQIHTSSKSVSATRLHIVWSKTFCLILVSNLGVFPLFKTRTSCVMRYSHKFFPVGWRLNYPVLYGLHPVRSFSFLSALYSTSPLNSFRGDGTSEFHGNMWNIQPCPSSHRLPQFLLDMPVSPWLQKQLSRDIAYSLWKLQLWVVYLVWNRPSGCPYSLGLSVAIKKKQVSCMRRIKAWIFYSRLMRMWHAALHWCKLICNISTCATLRHPLTVTTCLGQEPLILPRLLFLRYFEICKGPTSTGDPKWFTIPDSDCRSKFTYWRRSAGILQTHCKWPFWSNSYAFHCYR